MHFELVQDLRAEAADVEAAYVNDDFLAGLGRLPQLGSPVFLDRRPEGARIRQRVRYSFIGRLSAAVTAVVDPKRLTWVEDALIDPTSHVTTFTILPDHYAGLLEASGTIHLEAVDGGGTLRRTDGDVHVHVPFVAGKVEAAIISGLRDYAAMEADALDRWVKQGNN